MYDMNKKDIEIVCKILNETYGTEVKCYLHYTKPYELLVATILSAQCTDERVNKITEKLFVKYNTLEAFAYAQQAEMEKDIVEAGLFHNKAKGIIGACRIILEEYNGEMPNDIEVLTKLPSVGRKTANVIRGNIFGIQSIVVDTHVKRISKLLGITKEDDPVKIEMDLMNKLPESQWILYNKQLIAHGRSICIARRPKCEICPLSNICKHKEQQVKCLRGSKKDKK